MTKLEYILELEFSVSFCPTHLSLSQLYPSSVFVTSQKSRSLERMNFFQSTLSSVSLDLFVFPSSATLPPARNTHECRDQNTRCYRNYQNRS
mmetsp:Transcript_1740/g.6118  ORF Transcript_1740/g.6118 Transcript_1740/m.6118 type:complete len:92 (+) Transcript_1740:2939-3214(+)